MSENTQEGLEVTQIDGDMLGQLLSVAAEKAAQREAEQALRKGYVTREQTNLALAQLSENLEGTLFNKITESLGDLVEQAVKKAVTVDEEGRRKSTIEGGTSLEAREADPVSYLLRKGKEQGPESFDDVDKRIIWAMTYKALSQGMILDQNEED